MKMHTEVTLLYKHTYISCDMVYSFYHDFSFFLDSILSHLLFPHTWVRLMASRLFGLLFSTFAPDKLISLSSTTQEYLAIDLDKKVQKNVDDR